MPSEIPDVGDPMGNMNGEVKDKIASSENGADSDEKKSDSEDGQESKIKLDDKNVGEEEDLEEEDDGDEESVDLEGEDDDVGNAAAASNDPTEKNDHSEGANGAAKSPLRQKRKSSSDDDSGLQPNLIRPRKCPTKDSILIDVPLHVTADLGVALRRTRRKRVRRIHHWVKSATGSPEGETSEKKMIENGNVEDETKSTGATEAADAKDPHDEKDQAENKSNDLMEDEESENGMPKREQYGSVLDYLEAKYVRGVMIADYDERERAKKKKRNKNGRDDGDNSNEGDDSDDDGKGSCYEDDEGDFLDDSLLHEEVADQVLASSSYGKTRIEEEASRRKKRKREKSADGAEGGSKADGDESDEDDKSDNMSDDGAESDFDDGFFVNVGDLEMAEGWKGDEGIVMAPSKKNKKARGSGGGKIGRPKGSKNKVKFDKDGNEIVRPLKNTPTQSSVDRSATTSVSAKKKKVTGKSKGKPAAKAKPVKKNGKPKAVVDSNPKKKERKKPGPKPKPKAEKESKTKEKKTKKATHTTTKKVIKAASAKVVKPKTLKPPPKPETPKEKAASLRKLITKKYNACVKLIKDLTSDELPAKKKSKSTVKVSVNIPPDKTTGDEITFENPNVPGQKLKVKIPAKADLKKRCFVVSVPAPKLKDNEKKENNIPKDLKEALFDYSNAYDDWTTAECKYLATLPEDKTRERFKPNVQRLKKFDEMIKEFPQNIITPIDVSYLRLIVRRVRNNKAKIQARKDGTYFEAKKDAKKLNGVEIKVPLMGTQFSRISFDNGDFEEETK